MDGQHGVWNRISASFDATRRHAWPHVATFLASIPPGARVLDLMCGNGRHLVTARTAGLDAVGLDWSVPLVERAAAHAPAVVGDAAALPFRSRTFDAAVYVAGLHGIPDTTRRLASLQELHRVLRPAAVAQVTVWSRHAPRFAAHDLPAGPADIVVPWRADGHDEPRTVHLYDADSLEAACRAAGFAAVTVDEVAVAAAAPDNLVATLRR